jgi:hypothetical protein
VFIQKGNRTPMSAPRAPGPTTSRSLLSPAPDCRDLIADVDGQVSAGFLYKALKDIRKRLKREPAPLRV